MQGPFHGGELEMQRRAGVLDEAQAVGRVIARKLPSGAGRFLARQRLAVASSLEASGRVWASLLTGSAGFIAPADPQLVRLATEPMAGDPLADNLAARPELGLLVLDPLTRQRMRFNGRSLLSPDAIFLLVDQVYGNCPKYIQRRLPEADVAVPDAGTPRVAARLDARQQAAIARADTFFIASCHAESGADASHRGGYPGFVHVAGSERLHFPDYPGNSMFNTLGNLSGNPQAGLLFVDFTTGDVLQLAGRARIRPDFSVAFQVDEVRETPGGCPLRFSLAEYSPANPRLSQTEGAGISSHSRTVPAQGERDDEAHRLQ